MSFDDWRNSPKREAGSNFPSAARGGGGSTYQAGGASSAWGGGGDGGYGGRGAAPSYGASAGGAAAAALDDNAAFSKASQKVSAAVQEINQNAAQITKMVQLLGVPGQDSREMRTRLNHLVGDTGTLSKSTFKEVQTMTRYGKAGNRSIVDRLTSDYNRAVENFGEVGKLAAAKEKSVALPPAPVSGGGRGGGGGSAFSLGDGIPYDEEGSFGGRGGQDERMSREQAQALQNELEYNEAEIRERDQGVREIERAMTDVHEIFVHMATMVQEQGVMVDNIESHIDSAVADASKGVYELRQAEGYQKSARTKTCIILIILLVVVCVVIVLLILGVTLGLKWTDIKDKL